MNRKIQNQPKAMLENGVAAYIDRHLGPNETDQGLMLKELKVSNLDALMTEAIPNEIRTPGLNLPAAMSEQEYLAWIHKVGKQNEVFRSFLGQGFYPTNTPKVIQRMVLENPGWYTQYTPYQPEISQGRLEALLNFQTMIVDLTAMEVANASLLDEASAAAEAMQMMFRLAMKSEHTGCYKFLVVGAFPTTLDVLLTRAEPLGIEILSYKTFPDKIPSDLFGALIQCPDFQGQISDLKPFIQRLHEANLLVAVATDLLYCSLYQPPGEAGADIAIGNSQRFGVPMGFGGPHAAFFATKQAFIREIPGRIIGVSIDRHGQQAYRMTLQTREQHIKRDKATSNICTAQALLAIIAGFYAIYHGHTGIKAIASLIHAQSLWLGGQLTRAGLVLVHNNYFDTLWIRFEVAEQVENVIQKAAGFKINLQRVDEWTLGISLDEQTTAGELKSLLACFNIVAESVPESFHTIFILPGLQRTSPFLTHPVFNLYHSETELMRYIKTLESKDLSLCNAMIPLGSCTMKLNSAVVMAPISDPNFNQLHPFIPVEQAKGYQIVIHELEQALAEITGLPGVSLQPNSGAQGEYAGLMTIHRYFAAQQSQRKVIFIPSSAHGTNPASAAMSGMEIVIIKCKPNGEVDLEDLKNKLALHSDRLAGLMITYPSTHGIYEESIVEITGCIHQHGGLVYMDGANMNAQVGLTNPAKIGADVCHLNLHKTFSIPHGGGGPGMGPICVKEFLIPFLPSHRALQSSKNTGAVGSTPWGSASILLISLGYIKLLGAAGLKNVSEVAILNANYLMQRLAPKIPTLYRNRCGRVAHELILDVRGFKTKAGVDVSDFAKRLIDYSFHPPTVSFPVPGTLMVEPTESESKAELDRFCEALFQICHEIEGIEQGLYLIDDNPLKNAPHTWSDLVADEWKHPYSREVAVFPDKHLKRRKFWASVGRINDPWGDRQLFCTCPPVETESNEDSQA